MYESSSFSFFCEFGSSSRDGSLLFCSSNRYGLISLAAMADKRLRNILSHLSPPVIATSSESPPAAGLSKLGRDGRAGLSGHLFECEGPNSDREVKLLENLLLSGLRRFENCDAELRLVPCRGEPKFQDMAEEHVVKLETMELEDRDPQTELEDSDLLTELESGEAPTSSEENRTGDRKSGPFDGERSEAVRSGVTSASAVSSSGAVDGQLQVKLEKKSKSMSYLRVASCEFCDIIQGTAPCLKLYEDELCLCILDINPLSVGHSLIVPKSHFSCLEATPPQVAAAMCAAVPLISRALLAATRCDSFNMLVNSGVAAGQVIMHTHFHIIPRCAGDGLWKSESAKRRPLRKVQEAKLLAQAVRSKLSSMVGPMAQ